jgi:SecD/SecF fusion protein
MRRPNRGRAWSRPGRRGNEGTLGRVLLRVIVVGVLTVALSGCDVISGMLPDELRGSALAPAEALCIQYEVLASDGQDVTPELLEQTRTIIEERVNATGVAEPMVQTRGANAISVELPGLAAEFTEEVRRLIGTPGVLAFMPVPAGLQGSVTEGPLPEGMADIEPLFTSVEIASATIAEDSVTSEVVVDLQLKDTGARLFDEYAEEHYGEQFAIVLDDRVMSAPVIQATRFGGRAQISGGQGGFSVNEANRLVTVLKFGPLPLPVREVSAGACGGAPVSSPPS